jgi:hypothetical protein
LEYNNVILIALFIGVILVVVAIKGNGGSLFSALGQDVPAFVVWGSAVVALGAIGFVPGLKPISRGLLALLIIVIILRDYQSIIAGLKGGIAGQTAAPATTSLVAAASTPVAAPTVSTQTTQASLNTSAPSVAGSTLGNVAPTLATTPFGVLQTPIEASFASTFGNSISALGGF